MQTKSKIPLTPLDWLPVTTSKVKRKKQPIKGAIKSVVLGTILTYFWGSSDCSLYILKLIPSIGSLFLCMVSIIKLHKLL